MYYFTYSSYCPHIINPSKYHSNPCFVDCISKLSKVRLLVGGGVETPGNLCSLYCTILSLVDLSVLSQTYLRDQKHVILDNRIRLSDEAIRHGIRKILLASGERST